MFRAHGEGFECGGARKEGNLLSLQQPHARAAAADVPIEHFPMDWLQRRG
jgi:hypothetical protein